MKYVMIIGEVLWYFVKCGCIGFMRGTLVNVAGAKSKKLGTAVRIVTLPIAIAGIWHEANTMNDITDKIAEA